VSAPVGVLVMAHGTPATVAEIESFYTRIRRGRPPSPDQLGDLVRRYETIGGVSPLAERTRAQVEGIAAALEVNAPGRYRVAFGAKHTEPSIEDAATALAGQELRGIVGIVLTPHQSARGSGEYLGRAADAVTKARPGLPFVPVDHWYDAAGFTDLVAARLADVLTGADEPTVLFTAHSVPVVASEDLDPYAAQVQASAELVAAAAGLADASVPWAVAWQSAGRTEQEWLGPDLLATIDSVAAERRGSVVACPIGFVSDHLEVLYDLDIEAAARARDGGLQFSRTASLNDDPAFVDTLARVIERAAESGGLA
jgi:protoporphyrin/coproporphyrin ferrochelatase